MNNVLHLFVCSLAYAVFVGAPQKIFSAEIDPAESINAAELSSEDATACRKSFAALASDDFDTRETALNRLISRGPAVLKLADEFSKSNDPEIAAQAKGLQSRLLTSFDGFLRTSAGLRSVLARRCKPEQNVKLLDQFARKLNEAGGSLVVDSRIQISKNEDSDFAEQIAFADGAGRKERTVGEVLQLYCNALQLGGVPRGNVFLITTIDTAQKLQLQRHTFDWSGLGLDRQEAESIAKTWQVFFPNVSTEIHAASEAFTIRGSEEAIARAARLIAMLKPGSPDVIWPALKEELPIAEITEKLAQPVTLTLNSQDPLDAISQLKKQNIDVFCVTGPPPDEDVRQTHPFAGEINGASPLRLNLHDLPAGLVLRWIQNRAKFPATDQREMMMGYEIGTGGRLQFRFQPRLKSLLDQSISGADVSFLYPRGAKTSIDNDLQVKKLIVDALASHLALFPSCNLESDLTVLRGRMFFQGPHATLTRALVLIKEWRDKNTVPAPATWRATIDAQLDSKLDWDGRNMTAGKLIPTLRKLGKVPVLLEDAPDGSPASFQLTAKDAELLPPGPHTLRELLEELAARANAEWRVELGAIVITPRVEKKKKNVD